jgi:ABC-type Fe3+ transport system substrate-binding protein
LGDRKIPTTWKELLSDDYKDSVSVPVGDFDLFNSLLLHIYEEFGEKGIKDLGKIMAFKGHPSKAIKQQKQSAGKVPAVTIMPYFFSRMAGNMPNVKIIWPEDGSILSPIYALVRKDNYDKVKFIADILASEKFGKILAHSGLFPSTHPNVDNFLNETQTFKWIGWDYAYKNDIEKKVGELVDMFAKYSEEV